MFLYLNDTQHNLKRIESFIYQTCHFFESNILIQILFFMLHSNLTVSQRCLVCDNEFALTALTQNNNNNNNNN